MTVIFWWAIRMFLLSDSVISVARMVMSFWNSGSYLLPPANAVCEGNVFTGVCLSGGGICPEGVLCPGGSLSRRGSLSRGSLSGESLSRGDPPPLYVNSGRYASYWNAFLFFSMILCNYFFLVWKDVETSVQMCRCSIQEKHSRHSTRTPYTRLITVSTHHA